MTNNNKKNINKRNFFSGFYKLSTEERLAKIRKFNPNITEEDISLFLKTGPLDLSTINRMIENAIGILPVPLGLGVNFLINNKLYAVPMAIEEPSVIAAASSAAKLTLETGGFQTSSTAQLMYGQIQIVDIANPKNAVKKILEHKEKIIEIANANHPTLVSHGGGARDLRTRILETKSGEMVICEIIADCQDAMGANTMSAMAEETAPLIEELTKGRVLLRILSNFSDQRLASASCIVKKEALGGEQVVDDIITANAFAENDPYRAATHNKGIMNGISAVVQATGNDTRAIEAGIHAYAARNGQYSSLTSWLKNTNGDLEGKLIVPLALGTIGGATKSNPIAKVALKILNVKHASDLAQIIAAVGLAQNLGALRALVTAGIINGHMKLHAKNVAISAGAKGSSIDQIAQKMIQEENVKFSRAKELLSELKLE
jgi:hydroxymethylglutaryl-CoA reductase